MKTNILKCIAIAVIILVPAISKAQVSFNLKQGIVASTLSELGNLGDNNHISISYTAGGFAVIPLFKGLSLQPEVNYICKGRFEEITESGLKQKITQSYNFIQVPVLLRLTSNNLLGSSKAKIFCNGGIYEGFLLNSENRVKAGDESISKDITDNSKKNDFGVAIGGGVQFPVRQLILQFDLRYEMGLTKITNQPDDFRTKALSLTMGIQF